MQRQNISCLTAVAVCGFAFLVGCGKKVTQTPTPPNTAVSALAADQAAQLAAPNTPVPPAEVPGTSQATLAEAQAAWKAKEYDKAAAMMVSLQTPAGRSVTPEQAAAIQNKMRQFQQDLMGASASGDANARAAIQRLRAASTPH